MTYSDASPLKA